MERMSFDTPSQAVAQLCELLGVNETYLAGFLGVTSKSLADWKKRQVGDLPPKGHRLIRLYEVVAYLRERHSEIPTKDYKGLLENGRFTVDPAETDEDSTISLLNFIIEEPRARAWVPCVDQVAREYQHYLRTSGQLRETNRPVRHAL